MDIAFRSIPINIEFLIDPILMIILVATSDVKNIPIGYALVVVRNVLSGVGEIACVVQKLNQKKNYLNIAPELVLVIFTLVA